MKNEESSDHKDTCNADHLHRPWYLSRALAVCVFVAMFFSWLISFRFISEAALDPSLVILKSEGCAYLQHHHIGMIPYPSDGTCAAEVQFRREPFGEGGLIILEDRNLTISGHRIIAVEPINDRPLSPEQRRLWAYMAIVTVPMLGALLWMGSTL